MAKNKKEKVISFDQICFELFVVEYYDEEQHINQTEILEENETFLTKHPEIKDLKLIDSYAFTTPKGEGLVLAEIIRTLVFVYSERTIGEMMQSLSTYMRETHLNNQEEYQNFIPKEYIKRFFEFDMDGAYDNLEEAIENASDYGDFSGLISKDEQEGNFNDYEKEEYGSYAFSNYDRAGVYNYVLAMLDNEQLANILSNYYFIS